MSQFPTLLFPREHMLVSVLIDDKPCVASHDSYSVIAYAPPHFGLVVQNNTPLAAAISNGKLTINVMPRPYLQQDVSTIESLGLTPLESGELVSVQESIASIHAQDTYSIAMEGCSLHLCRMISMHRYSKPAKPQDAAARLRTMQKACAFITGDHHESR